MSTNIKLKRSAVSGRIPSTGDLALGELAINTFDGKLFMKKDDGTESIVDITSGGGGAAYTTGSTELSTTDADQVVDFFSRSLYRTVKYYVEFSTASAYQATELLLTHDGTTVYITEYATIASGSNLGTINSDISGENVRLLVTPVNTDTTVKFARIEVASTGGSSGGGGASALADLTDVDVATVAPTNGQVLKYNTTSSKWEPDDDNDSGGGSSTTLEQGNFSTSGDAITREYVLRGTTTNATETELFYNTSDRIPVGANTTVYYTVDIVARRTDATGEGAAFQLKGIADNFSGTVADIGLVYEVIVARDDSNYSVDAGADDTNDAIYVKVTGVAAKTIRWVAYVRTVEVAQ
jgi:hypothetical protein